MVMDRVFLRREEFCLVSGIGVPISWIHWNCSNQRTLFMRVDVAGVAAGA